MWFETERLFLKLLSQCGGVSVHDFETRNREFLKPFEPLRPESFFAIKYWESNLEKQNRSKSQSDMRWSLCPKSDEARVMGRIDFSGIIRGVFQACCLGFVKEGIARDYLCINGKWEDHVLTSLINSN